MATRVRYRVQGEGLITMVIEGRRCLSLLHGRKNFSICFQEVFPLRKKLLVFDMAKKNI